MPAAWQPDVHLRFRCVWLSLSVQNEAWVEKYFVADFFQEVNTATDEGSLLQNSGSQAQAFCGEQSWLCKGMEKRKQLEMSWRPRASLQHWGETFQNLSSNHCGVLRSSSSYSAPVKADLILDRGLVKEEILVLEKHLKVKNKTLSICRTRRNWNLTDRNVIKCNSYSKPSHATRRKEKETETVLFSQGDFTSTLSGGVLMTSQFSLNQTIRCERSFRPRSKV